MLVAGVLDALVLELLDELFLSLPQPVNATSRPPSASTQITRVQTWVRIRFSPFLRGVVGAEISGLAFARSGHSPAKKVRAEVPKRVVQELRSLPLEEVAGARHHERPRAIGECDLRG